MRLNWSITDFFIKSSPLSLKLVSAVVEVSDCCIYTGNYGSGTGKNSK
jgi:hypothetical protein